MNRLLKKKILYAPLFASMLFIGNNAVYAQEGSINYKNKIIELEARISSLEQLKQELNHYRLTSVGLGACLSMY